MLRQSTLLVFTLLLLSSCKAKVLEIKTEAYIIGDNDIKPLDAIAQNSVPDIAWKSSVILATVQNNGKLKFCSGSFILPEKGRSHVRVIANQHCFAVADENNLPKDVLIEEACKQTRVWSGFSKANDFSTKYANCIAGSLKTDYVADLSIFEVDQIPAGAEPNDFEGTFEDNMEALIVHYPSIKEQYEALSGTNVRLPAASITQKDCTVIGRFPREDWSLDKSLEFGLRHTCDLIHGSSGSALLNKETGKIIGINWGGIKLENSDGEQVYNVATLASYATAFSGLSDVSFEEEKAQLRESGTSDGRKNKSKKKKGFEKKIADAIPGCGVVGLGAQGSWLLALPLLLLCFRRKRDCPRL